MGATLPASVACSRCKKFANFDHDELRELVERGELPVCNRCLLTPDRYVRQSSPDTAVVVMLKAVAAVETADRSASLTDIIVRAWQADPLRFGLPGAAQTYPDSNRVNAEVVKAAGKGLLFRVRPREYRLSAAGREYLGRLREAVPCPTA